LSLHGAGYRNARVRAAAPVDPLLWLSLTRHMLEEESENITLTAGDGSKTADIHLHPPDAKALGYLFADDNSRPLSGDVAYRLAEGWESVCLENARNWSGSPTLLESVKEDVESPQRPWKRLTKLITTVFPRLARD
jgi:hypothetical protein